MMPETPAAPDADHGTEHEERESRRVIEMPPGATPETAQHPPAKRSLDEAQEDADSEGSG